MQAAKNLLIQLRDRDAAMGMAVAAAMIQAAVPANPVAKAAFFLALAEFLLAALDGVPIEPEELVSEGE